VVRDLLAEQRGFGITPVLVAFYEDRPYHGFSSDIEQHWIARGGSTYLNHHRLYQHVKKVLRSSSQPAVLNAHELRFSGMVGAKLKRKFNVPLLVTVHADPVGDSDSAGKKLKLRRRAAGSADALIAVSNFVKDKLEILLPQEHCPDQLRLVAYSGCREIEFGEFSAPDFVDGNYMLVLSRLRRGKGLPWLVESWAKSGIGRRGWRLVIAGTGALAETLMQQARSLGIQQQVLFVGYIDGREKFRALAHCQVVLVPTYPLQEGLGLTAVEALGAGKPVIAAASGGLCEVVADGQTGLLVQGGDTEALAGAIVTLADDDLLRKKLGENTQAHRKQFSWQQTAAVYDRCYCQLLS